MRGVWGGTRSCLLHDGAARTHLDLSRDSMEVRAIHTGFRHGRVSSDSRRKARKSLAATGRICGTHEGRRKNRVKRLTHPGVRGNRCQRVFDTSVAVEVVSHPSGGLWVDELVCISHAVHLSDHAKIGVEPVEIMSHAIVQQRDT